MEFQLGLKCGWVVAPYFFARDIDDSRFRTNLNFVSSAKKYLTAKNIKKKLFAIVNIGSIVLESPRNVDFIVEQYGQFDLDGYLVMIENFDDRHVGYELLMGLSRMVRLLSEKNDVIVLSISSFGEVLIALGANGFSSGVGWLETFGN